METNYIYIYNQQGSLNKGVNSLSSFYFIPQYDLGLPVGTAYVLKDKKIVAKQSKTTYKINKSKNDLMPEMVYAYYNMMVKSVLADSWFSSVDNMLCITDERNTKIILTIKSNPFVVLDKEEKGKGIYHNIESLEPERRSISVYLKQYSKLVLIAKPVFKNRDVSTAKLYLAASDLNLDYKSFTKIYEKRWKVEEFFRSLKNNTTFAKALTKIVRTQSAHFTAFMIAFIKLGRLKVRHIKNHDAKKSEIWLIESKATWQELEKLITPQRYLNRYAA